MFHINFLQIVHKKNLSIQRRLIYFFSSIGKNRQTNNFNFFRFQFYFRLKNSTFNVEKKASIENFERMNRKIRFLLPVAKVINSKSF